MLKHPSVGLASRHAKARQLQLAFVMITSPAKAPPASARGMTNDRDAPTGAKCERVPVRVIHIDPLQVVVDAISAGAEDRYRPSAPPVHDHTPELNVHVPWPAVAQPTSKSDTAKLTTADMNRLTELSP